MLRLGKETILYNFGSFSGDGANPYGSIVEYTDGNFYGMTSFGGTSNNGTLFKCTPGGIETVLYNFAGGTDGARPYGSLLKGSDGDFYGMTSMGGTYNLGIIFKCTPGGIETVLHNFTGGAVDGAVPYGSLIQGSDGNFYGMTSLGGVSDLGTIFEFSASGSLTVLNSLTINTGSYPHGDLLELEGKLIQQGKITVYPNPNSGTFTVEALITGEQLRIDIYNLLGQKIFTTNLSDNGNTIVHMNTPSTGLYLYRVVTQNKKIVGKGKLIINK